MKNRPGTFTVVLTGGIASGKTAVSDQFSRLGAAVVDTDVIARQMVEPGQTGLSQIIAEFGPGFLDPDGRLDRRKMRHAIFSDPAQRARLESILHPLIAADVARQIRRLESPYCILVIPLYTESSAYSWIDRVLVVDVSEKVQLARVMERDKITREQAQAILDSQSSRQARLALADDIIDNSGSLAELETRVAELHEKYLELAKSRS